MGGILSRRKGKHHHSSKPPPATMRKFEPILDHYHTLEQVQVALRQAGLESSNLILGVDFTKSNTWTGERTFGGQCLHTITPDSFNPYQSVIHIIGKTLAAFDDDNFIPAFGFGDVYTQDKRCFPFFPDRPCQGFEEVLLRYNHIVPGLQLAGPTNFAPVINEAVRIVNEAKGYHILVIVADGQVTAYKETVEAIVRASKYPLSIVCVGVGDGPWDMMREFDDKLPSREFDNFQFVEYNAVIQQHSQNPEPAFALSALMEIPEQFMAIRDLGYLG